MKKNLGSTDRAIRLVLAVICIVLPFQSIVSSTTSIVLFSVAGILVLTSIAGFCPLYKLFGINSLPEKKAL